MIDSYEREALRRALRRLRAAVVDHKQYNGGQHPQELTVSPATYLLLRSSEHVNDEQYCERLRLHIRMG